MVSLLGLSFVFGFRCCFFVFCSCIFWRGVVFQGFCVICVFCVFRVFVWFVLFFSENLALFPDFWSFLFYFSRSEVLGVVLVRVFIYYVCVALLVFSCFLFVAFRFLLLIVFSFSLVLCFPSLYGTGLVLCFCVACVSRCFCLSHFGFSWQGRGLHFPFLVPGVCVVTGINMGSRPVYWVSQYGHRACMRWAFMHFPHVASLCVIMPLCVVCSCVHESFGHFHVFAPSLYFT